METDGQIRGLVMGKGHLFRVLHLRLLPPLKEKNRMGKTRDLFKKIRGTKGIFHAKIDSIKDRNGMDLTEQKILRRGGENTQSK